MKIQLPIHIKNIIDKLTASGYEAYAVGGSIRNSIMKLPVNDWDITTNAKPDEVKKVFNTYRTIDTGLKHGTVTLVDKNENVEITTFRIDGDYSDNRHPDKVTFSSDIKDDLSRRDFTVNAIAYNDTKGIIDPFGGVEDIKNKTLKCVGNAHERFDEDALRILRALRFSAVYGLSIEEDTDRALRCKALLLKNISAQRIAKELTGMITGEYAADICRNYREVLSAVIPELAQMFDVPQDNPHHDKDVWLHTCAVIEASPCDTAIRYAALFHDIGKPSCKTMDENKVGHFYGHAEASVEIAQAVMKRLCFSNSLTNDVLTLVKYHDRLGNIGVKGIKRLLGKIGDRLFEKLLLLTKADMSGQSKYNMEQKLKSYNEKIDIYRQIKEENLCCNINRLAIDGKDLIEIGYTQGKQIGDMLSRLTDLVIDGELENNREVLLSFAKEKKINS